MELDSLLILIMARRETALEDSDANLSFLLATCYTELLRYDKKLELVLSRLDEADVSGVHSVGYVDFKEIDKEITFEKLLEEFKNKKED